MTISQINIYPVKSLDGYSVASAVVEKRGLQHDRCWMITDTEGVFVTQRVNGKMALLQAVVEDNTLTIKEKQNELNFIEIKINASSGLENTVTVWDDTVKAASVSAAADAWLSAFLGKEYRLVVMPETTKRRVDENYNTGQDVVSFADGYPFLIIGEASMAELNERVLAKNEGADPLSIRRFRTNFVFTGGTAHAEDSLKNFKIGNVDFLGVKPCARCVLTTRDPDTGVKGKEPLLTLGTYRQVNNKILFGQNLVWQFGKWSSDELPVVRVGDIISVF